MSASGELKRLRYLAAMGVPVYVTRRALPGAAVTRKLALRTPRVENPESEPDAAQSVGGSVVKGSANVVRSNASPQAAQALRESLQKDREQPGVIRSALDPASPPDPAPRDSGEPATRFRLAVMVCAGRLWLEALGDEALAQEQVRLVTAMGLALTHPRRSDDAPAVSEFRWPLHDNAQLGLGAQEAAATLQGFVSRQLEQHACVELICLGDASKALLKNLQVPCARRYLVSTRAMLENPLLKRDNWATLQT